jgi:hypothetical protein
MFNFGSITRIRIADWAGLEKNGNGL